MPPIQTPATSSWERWQANPVATSRLTTTDLQEGYTVLRVHPACREAFLVLVALLNVYAALVSHRHCPSLVKPLWRSWVTWTRRLTAYLQRIRAGEDGTCPPCPFWEEQP